MMYMISQDTNDVLLKRMEDENYIGNALAKILCILCCLVIAGSVLLPYLTLDASEMVILNTSTDVYRLADETTIGGLVLIIAAVGLVFSVIGWYLISAVAGLAAIGATFYIHMAIEQKIPDFLAHYGTAYYLLLIGGIALVVASVIGFAAKAAARKAQ